MTDQIEYAIQQNNTAVYLIEAGDYVSAIIHISSALHILKKSMEEVDLQHGNRPMETHVSLDACMTQSAAAQADEEEGHYMYQQAIRLPSGIEFNDRSSPVILSMIIFNLALAHQLSAVGSNKSDLRMRKAAKLYELGYNLQRAEHFDNNVLFTMATVNNMGLLHHKLNDRETGNRCFEHLLSTLMFLIDCSKGHVYGIDGFLRNASHVISAPHSAAAA